MPVISHLGLFNKVNTLITRNSTFPGPKVTALHCLMDSSPVTEPLIITSSRMEDIHSKMLLCGHGLRYVLPQLTIKSNSNFLMDLLQKNLLI